MLKLKHVKKAFPDKIVLQDINLEIKEKENIALIGPNGAGKTTLINCLLGLTKIDGGKIEHDFSLKQDVGVMMQQDIFPDGLNVTEAIDLHKGYYKKVVKSTQTLIKQAYLTKCFHTAITNLSGGERKRLSFAIAVSSNPKILFLDEPTVGMDLQTREAFWDTISTLKSEGMTFLITLHHFDEINDNCTRYLFLKDGQIKLDLTKEELNKKKVIAITGNELQLAKLQSEFGGLINRDIITFNITAVNREKILEFATKNDLIYEERLKRVQDVYLELYRNKESEEG